MSNITDIHQNYDAVFKESFTLYKNQSLDFLDLGLAPVQELLNTEDTEFVVKKSYEDLIFKLADDTGLNLEWEAKISKDDILRFFAYNVACVRKYKISFQTIILTNQKPAHLSYENDTIRFSPLVINLAERNGDELLAKIKKQLITGGKINEIELIYLPLYKSVDKTVVQLFEEVIQLVPKVTDDREKKQKIILLAALLTNKFISGDEYKRLWEEIEMVLEDIKLIKVGRDLAREEGREEGVREGIKEGKFEIVEKMLKAGLAIEQIIAMSGLSEEEVKEIQNGLKK